MSADIDVLVIGGGISGLATAWWLGRAGLSVEVWEREERIGGKIRTDHAGGYTTERSATLLTGFGSDVNALVSDANLERHVLPHAAAPCRYLADSGTLAELPTRAERILRSPLWSWRSRLRMLTEPFVPRGTRDGETVSEFIRRRLGSEVLEKAMEPYIGGPLGSDPDLAEARAVLPHLTALEARYGSLALGALAGRFGHSGKTCVPRAFSFAGGMETLVTTLASGRGVRVITGIGAASLAPIRCGFEVYATDNGSRRARQVVLGVPAHEAARLIAPLDARAARLLADIVYAPMNVVHLGLSRADVDHPLDGTGVLFPRAEHSALTGCMWTSTLFPGRAPAARVLLDCYLGGARQPDAAGWDDARSVEACLSALRPLLGVTGTPEMVRIDRHTRALPLYHGRHLARMAAIRTQLAAHPELHLAGNYDGGVSVRERIGYARSLAGRIGATLLPATTARRPSTPVAPTLRPDATIERAPVGAGP